MKVVILAAGYATRLYPLTQNKPKALLQVGDRAIIDHLCDKLDELTEVSEIIIVTNHRFCDQFEHWAASRRGSKPLVVLDDGTSSNDDRRGAMGDLGFALDQRGWSEDIMVLASDNLFDEGLKAFTAFCLKKRGVGVGAYDIKDKSIAKGRYGIFELDATQRVIGLEEKPESPKTSFVSMGVYFLPQEALGALEEYLASPERRDQPGHFVAWLVKQGNTMYAYVFKGNWYDIGSLEQLDEASRRYRKP